MMAIGVATAHSCSVVDAFSYSVVKLLSVLLIVSKERVDCLDGKRNCKHIWSCRRPGNLHCREKVSTNTEAAMLPI
jgi:hypothetical protein